MHVQDVDLNATPASGRGRGVQTSVGKGSDWVKTFKAAKIGGVRNYFSSSRTWISPGPASRRSRP